MIMIIGSIKLLNAQLQQKTTIGRKRNQLLW